MTTPDVDSIVEKALEAEEHGGKHDPRIDRMYRQDVIMIYGFVIALWVAWPNSVRRAMDTVASAESPTSTTSWRDP